MKPEPSNIQGRVVRTHSFEHSVTWNVSYIVVALVALYAIVKLGPTLSG